VLSDTRELQSQVQMIGDSMLQAVAKMRCAR